MVRATLKSKGPKSISITPSAVMALAQSFVMLSYQSQQLGLMMQATDPDWPSAALLQQQMLSGHVEQLRAGEFGIILGSQVARRLGVFVGDKLQLTLPKVSVTPAGIFPRIKSFVVTGIFQVGAQVDSSVSFVHQSDARKLLQLGARSCLPGEETRLIADLGVYSITAVSSLFA